NAARAGTSNASGRSAREHNRPCGRHRLSTGGTALSRPCSALLLLLGLARPGAAQAPNTAACGFALGDFTIYGHTDYTPTFVLLPRIVYDTARVVDSARAADSVRAAPTNSAAFAAGPS